VNRAVRLLTSAPAGLRVAMRIKPLDVKACHELQAVRSANLQTQRLPRLTQEHAEKIPSRPLRNLRVLCVAAPAFSRHQVRAGVSR